MQSPLPGSALATPYTVQLLRTNSPVIRLDFAIGIMNCCPNDKKIKVSTAFVIRVEPHVFKIPLRFFFGLRTGFALELYPLLQAATDDLQKASIYFQKRTTPWMAKSQMVFSLVDP